MRTKTTITPAAPARGQPVSTETTFIAHAADYDVGETPDTTGTSIPTGADGTTTT